MYNGRTNEEWNQTAEILAHLSRVNGVKARAVEFHPYGEAIEIERMQALEAEWDLEELEMDALREQPRKNRESQ